MYYKIIFTYFIRHSPDILPLQKKGPAPPLKIGIVCRLPTTLSFYSLRKKFFLQTRKINVILTGMDKENYVIGVDFGTDSVRSLLVNAADGSEIATAVFYYPRWKDGVYCNPAENRFRQHPLDYVEGLGQTILSCLSQAGPAATGRVRAISIDTTGSTPVAVDETGTPLGLQPAFRQPQRTLRPVERPYRRPGSRRDQCPCAPIPDQLPPVRRRHLFLRMVLGQIAPHPACG